MPLRRFALSPQQSAALRVLCKRYLRKALEDERANSTSELRNNIVAALEVLSQPSGIDEPTNSDDRLTAREDGRA